MLKRRVICIIGMHRSGTSALAGLLHNLGIKAGKTLLKPAKDNPKGFFENEKITLFNETKLMPKLATTWFDLTPLDLNNFLNFSDKEEYIKEAIEIIEEEYESEEIFCIKDPRLCILFPFWEEVFYRLEIEPLIIIPYRNPLEVSFSLLKRDGFSIGYGLFLWAKYNLYVELNSRMFRRVFVSYENLINNPKDELDKVQTRFGIEFLRNKNMEGFLDKKLKRFNFQLSDLPENTPDFIKELGYTLERLAKGEAKLSLELEKKFDEWRNLYESLIKEQAVIYEWISDKKYFFQVFIDIETGFTEENSIIGEVKPYSYIQEFVFELPENVKNFRFDPLNKRCGIKIERVEGCLKNGKVIDLTENLLHNGYNIDKNFWIFLHDDPQIWPRSQDDIQGIRSIKVRLQYFSLQSVNDILVEKLVELNKILNMLKKEKKQFF